MSDEVIHMGSDHEFYVTWDKAFGGHTTKLHIVQQGPSRMSMVTLTWDHSPAPIIAECPVEVMRRIVAMHDALPPIEVATKR